jgi:chlorobactene glucosyltransferase
MNSILNIVCTVLLPPQDNILIFLGVLWLIALFNVLTIRRLSPPRDGGGVDPPAAPPFVSILIPARDEAANIAHCVRSLLEQHYDRYEVIVLDDESQDETPEILRQLQAESPRLKVILGAPLPPGWRGKNWACHQLSQAARGDLLLFVDADTYHDPQMLPESVALFSASHASLLSGFPRQELHSFSERLVVPILAWAILCFFPIRLIQRIPIPFLSVAVGQFMLFDRLAYQQTGGHSAVRLRVDEDFALAQLVKKHRLRWEFANLSRRVHCRMYHNFGEVLNGLGKNLFVVFGKILPVFLFIWLFLGIVFLLPWIYLVLDTFVVEIPAFEPILAFAAILLSFCLWALSDLYFRMPLTSAFLYPLSIAITVFVALRSAWLHFFHRSIYWKGRDLQSP